jgi:hypothetical protein
VRPPTHFQSCLVRSATDHLTASTGTDIHHSRAHNYGNRTKTRDKQIISVYRRWALCKAFLGIAIQASLRITRGAGGLALSPSLRLRAIVPSNSAAFELIKHMPLVSPEHFDNVKIRTPTNEFQLRLFRLFQEGKASPSDVLANGNTFLHVSSTRFFYFFITLFVFIT